MRLLRPIHQFYKRWISPLFGNSCRFEPYCSDYALQAVEQHGVFKGGIFALWRVLRCNPYCRGGYDAVPPLGGPRLLPGRTQVIGPAEAARHIYVNGSHD